MEDPHGVQVIDDDGVWYDLDSQEDIEYDPHVGEVLGDDGIWYTKGLPEEKEESDPKPVANIFLMLYLSLPKIIYQGVGVVYVVSLPHQPNRHY